LRAMAAIGVAGGQHLLRHLATPGGAGKLADGLAVPIDAEPVETVEDRVDRRLGRSLAVSVLDAQQHLAAAPAGIEPVEQRGPSSADVEEAGRGRREAGDDGLSHAVQGKVQPTGQLARPCTIAATADAKRKLPILGMARPSPGGNRAVWETGSGWNGRDRRAKSRFDTFAASR